MSDGELFFSAIDILNEWLLAEQHLGAPNPRQVVLATAATDAIPHARVVALREITENGFLFFTQRGTRKVKELMENPHATIVFWFELHQREVIVEGMVESLTLEDNKNYWSNYSREAQMRFHSYAPTSAQPISNKAILENKKKELEQEFQDKLVPFCEFYCGFRLKPSRMVFYSYRTDELSDVIEYKFINGEWEKQILSP